MRNAPHLKARKSSARYSSTVNDKPPTGIPNSLSAVARVAARTRHGVRNAATPAGAGFGAEAICLRALRMLFWLELPADDGHALRTIIPYDSWSLREEAQTTLSLPCRLSVARASRLPVPSLSHVISTEIAEGFYVTAGHFSTLRRENCFPKMLHLSR